MKGACREDGARFIVIKTDRRETDMTTLEILRFLQEVMNIRMAAWILLFLQLIFIFFIIMAKSNGV